MPTHHSRAHNPATARRTDSQIAAEAKTRLTWDAAIPKNAIKVKVSHGRIKLLGELNHEQQRTAALEDVTRLFGVTAVLDHTTIKQP
ncbi:BON domain-containing protein [Paraburkholderia sp. RL17-337-BIB-A]|uniref:BON domain-containing protein n=1 Tax=Paraburkholderia sp. RL17-337-BIB-A TaxID=3031636 RepID=UPI0038B9A5EB